MRLFIHMCECEHLSALWSANGSVYILLPAYFDNMVISVPKKINDQLPIIVKDGSHVGWGGKGRRQQDC